MPDFINSIITIFQLIISFGTVCTLLYAFTKFTQRPQETQDERIAALEVRVSKLEDNGADISAHIANIDRGNMVMQKAMLAMIDHAIGNEDEDNIKKARKALYDYLTSKEG